MKLSKLIIILIIFVSLNISANEPLTYLQKTTFDRESKQKAKTWQEAQHIGQGPTNCLTRAF